MAVGSGGRSESLTNHPTRANWFPAPAGLMVHSIGFDASKPSRLIVGVSAAGARVPLGRRRRVVDARRTPACARTFCQTNFRRYGQCVHHMEMHPQRPDVLYQQNHCGVYRSDDGGDSWNDISNGLPSRFGFRSSPCRTMAIPSSSSPEESDQARMTADATIRYLPQSQRGRSWDR